MRGRFTLWVLFLVLGSAVPSAVAEKLHVVTRDAEPFSFERNGQRVGFSIDLWQRIARDLGVDYDIRVVATAQQMVDALANKTAGVAVGALSVTSSREAVIDFSQPFYESGLQIVVPTAGASTVGTVRQLAANFFNWKLIGAFTLLIIVMVAVSHLVWLYEHKVNPEMWPATYHHGLWESFWWSISILLVGGADNKGPIGVGGRIVAIAWMLLSFLLLAVLTASFTATITVNNLKSDIAGPGDLPGRTIATIAGTTTESWLHAHNCRVRIFANLPDCLEAVKNKQADAAVYDAPLLEYALKQDGDDKLRLLAPIFNRQNYAIGLQQDSLLRESIDRELLILSESGVNEDLREKWFGTKND